MSQAAPRPFRGSLAEAWKTYRQRVVSFLRATAPPLFIIALLRWLSDDYTGDQYAVLIAAISLFNILLTARIAAVGWDRKKTKQLSYSNAVMSRWLPGLILFAISLIHCFPGLVAILLLGLVAAGQASLWWLIPLIPLAILGVAAFLLICFAVFALMDDMSTTVMQTVRISSRLARRYLRPLMWRSGVWIGALALIAIILAWSGNVLAGPFQDIRGQLVLDAVVGWIVMPFLFCYGASIYRRAIEAYD